MSEKSQDKKKRAQTVLFYLYKTQKMQTAVEGHIQWPPIDGGSLGTVLGRRPRDTGNSSGGGGGTPMTLTTAMVSSCVKSVTKSHTSDTHAVHGVSVLPQGETRTKQKCFAKRENNEKYFWEQRGRWFQRPRARVIAVPHSSCKS